MAYIAHGVIVGFKLTNNKITEITYKEKCFLEFQITRLRFLIQKGSSGHWNLFLTLGI